MYFKKLYKVYFAFFALSVLQLGCTKVEKLPLEKITGDLVFDTKDINGYYLDRALTNLYTYLPQGFNRIDKSFLDAATDDAVTTQYSSTIDILSKALQSPTQLVDNPFASNYTAICKANQFLANVDSVPVTATIKQYDKGDARFLRALFYFELIKRYGGVPIVYDKVFSLTDMAALPRNTYDECVAYIVSECDAASAMVRKEPVTSVEVGRATQGAVLALKARTLLYAASPLNNPTNDAAKWLAAANASKAVIDLNYYALNASFVAAFNTRVDKEVIFAFQQAKNQTLEKADSPVGYTVDLFTSSGGTSPTQELVDAFPTINGKSITADIVSPSNLTGYDAANPYANRDPRFKATIFYNGQLWLNRAVETFDGGKDRPGGPLAQTKTGFYLRKFLPDLSAASTYGSIDHNFIIFRYAETLLNYAEALNESADDPNGRTICYTQLTKLRARAGIVAGTGALYGLTANMTQSQMRDAIRLERRIELAFEEHRFWDMRRWKLAATDFNKTLHGVKITLVSPGVYSYQTVNIATIKFLAPQMYLYPIPYSELKANSALTQNPGW